MAIKMTAAERFKKRLRGGAPHTVNKKKTVEDNSEELPKVMTDSLPKEWARDKREELPKEYARDKRFDYTKYLGK